MHNINLCFSHQNEHNLKHNITNHSKTHNVGVYLFRMYASYPFSIINYHVGPPIKWWEDIGKETERSNTKFNITKNIKIISFSFHSKKFLYALLYRLIDMTEASSTKNMDLCVVEEDEIVNTSQKRSTTALGTITHKKPKSKKNLGRNSLWFGFHATNLINKQMNYLKKP